MPVPLLVIGAIALCGLFLGGCSSPKKSDTLDEDDSKDAIDEEETDTSLVEEAIVMCTCFAEGQSTSKITAKNNGQVTNGKKVLNNEDINFDSFTSCIKTEDKKCSPEIENKEWQEYDETHTTDDYNYTLLKDRSFMVCLNGGMLYITEDGQKLKDVEEILKKYRKDLEIGFCKSTQDLIIQLEGIPFLTPRINSNGTFTIGYGYDFTKKEDPEMFKKYLKKCKWENYCGAKNVKK